MMRLPRFKFYAPENLGEAARILAAEGSDAMLIAGGTDLLPNMKRRQQVPKTLISLRHIEPLRTLGAEGKLVRIGSGVTLSDLAADRRFANGLSALSQAASQVATPHIRNMATLGGNICLDTRCNYYDQSYEWRKAISFCKKKDGVTCWVAPSSPKCMAVSSTDTGPALIALGARVRLISNANERELPLADLYRNDGMDYLARRPDEILSEILIGPLSGWKSTYWKLRRRGSFDFPVLSVAAAVKISHENIVEDARIVIGSAASCPLLAEDAAKKLISQPFETETNAVVSDLAAKHAKPLDNTDFDMSWRKKVTAEIVRYALNELRGDDVSLQRRDLTRWVM